MSSFINTKRCYFNKIKPSYAKAKPSCLTAFGKAVVTLVVVAAAALAVAIWWLA